MTQDAPPRDIRARIVDAALQTLRREGFAGTSARSIARTGEFNSALIFYYFGSVNGLLLAALDHSSALRMARYRAAVEDARSVEDLVRVAAHLYAEDVSAGHITVFSELIGASLAHPDLRKHVMERAMPWLQFVQDTLTRYIAGTSLYGFVPVEELARAVLALYVGANLLTHLDPEGSPGAESIETVARIASVLAPLLESR
jgi:AcrR family transcriptional regulator